MKNTRRKQYFFCLFLFTIFCVANFGLKANAETTTTEAVNSLSDKISEKQLQLDQLESKIDTYTKKINEQKSLKNTLATDLSLLENIAAKNQLDLEQTELQIETVQDEIHLLDLEISQNEKHLENQKSLIASLLRKIQSAGNTGAMEMIFSHNNFSELFDDLSQLESLNKNLRTVLQESKLTRSVLDNKKGTKEKKLSSLVVLENNLEVEQIHIKESQSAKTLLVIKTQKSESEFQELLSELRQEQQYIDAQLFRLQKQIEEKITDSDILGDATLLSWPVSNYVITVLFHDPTYPFIHLFQHSGLDLAVPTGTPVKAAAPGYVAFTRTGSMYGNYIMVIHTNGIATLYAHLSSIDVQADQFVSRGDVIGLAGSTGFSTGPHLHFEVRSDGIPVDPLGYLVSL